MSQGLKSQLKTLIAAKQYQAAIVLLEASDMPDKQVFITRLQLRMKEEAKTVPAKAPAPTTKPPAAPRRNPFLRVALISAIALPVLFVAMAALNTYLNRYVDRMATTCESVYREDWLNETYTFNQWWSGCKDAAKAAMDRHGQEIRYCFDSHGQTDKLFVECLADQGVTISSSYLANAPRE